MLKRNRSLRELFLEGNDIGDEGAKAWDVGEMKFPQAVRLVLIMVITIAVKIEITIIAIIGIT